MNMIEIQDKTIAPAELYALVADGTPAELLDVRTLPEFTNAHVPGARLIPLHELNVESFLRRHEPGRPVYVLCQGGGRAKKAIEQFQSYGCSDCVLVEGGTQAWIDAGLPVNRGTSKVLPLMRQVQIVVGSLSAIGSLLAVMVNPWFAAVPLVLGCGLFFAGVTGICGLALLLARMPWNRSVPGTLDSCCTPGEK
jgi:rhodanese-related sulfurtransferase